jgi:FixJ family two-component response regulator
VAKASPTVFVIDPDPSVRTSIEELVSSMDLACSSFATAREFLAANTDSAPGCLVLEVSIPDMSGLQLQKRLAAHGVPLPLVFVSAYRDVSLAVELMRGGAVHYLPKPFRPLELVGAIQEALALDRSRHEEAELHQDLAEKVAAISARDRDVLRMIAEAQPNSVIAAKLGITVRTVELRRARLMEKLGAKSPMALLHFALLARRHRLFPVRPLGSELSAEAKAARGSARSGGRDAAGERR